ncbi:MAG: hypothetical protein HWE16_02005 [Gammaproteobacteria bacterium]|nr:hypothetical protein [Gammaproteobacteria bacterium]
MKQNDSSHWTQQKERGTLLGIKFLFFIRRYFGKWPLKIFLYPVITYFYLTGKSARRSSKNYLARLKANKPSVNTQSSFKHFLQFADAILDKLLSWDSRHKSPLEVVEPEIWREIRALPTGAIFMGAHLGNLDACRNQSDAIMGGKLNALMFTEHASKFIGLIKELSPEFEQQIIQVSEVGPDTAIQLQQKLTEKQHLFILADRIPQADTSKTVVTDFLGHEAEFGIGPFVLASILKVPVYFISALKSGDSYQLAVEPLGIHLAVSRKTRKQAIEQSVMAYAKWLEKQCEKAPMQWYNFYPFWRDESQ